MARPRFQGWIGERPRPALAAHVSSFWIQVNGEKEEEYSQTMTVKCPEDLC
jgi:hypothetical protein